MMYNILVSIRAIASRGAGGAIAPPVLGRSVNPISTRGDTLSPPSTTSPPDFQTLQRPCECKSLYKETLILYLFCP